MSIEKLFGSFYSYEETKGENPQPPKKPKKEKAPHVHKRGILHALSHLRPTYWLGRARLEKKLYYYTAIVGLIGLVGIFGGWRLIFPEKGEAAWFNDDWLYRKAINITAHTSAENNVYIELSGSNAIDSSDSTRFQSDCGDLRFTDASGKSLRYFIVSGCGTSTTVVDINLDSFPAGAQTFYYYYGNPSAPNGFALQGFPKAATSYTIGSLGSEENGPAPSAYWKFDEGTGTTAKDSSQNKYDGTLTGSTLPTWTQSQCISQSCLQFNGITSNVSVSSTVTGVKTIAFWVNPSASNSAEIMALNSLVDIRTTTGSVSAKWVTNPTIYVNGIQNGNSSQLGTLNANSWSYVVVTTSTAISASAITLGKGPLGVLKGYLDEVKFYPFVLTADQVKANYSTRGSVLGSSTFGSQDQSYLSNGLVGYWKMDETSADTCSGGSNDNCDSSGNGNDGAWNGDATASISAKFGAGVTLDGTGDFVNYSSDTPVNITGSITVGAWVKPTSVTGTHTITSRSGGSNSTTQYELRQNATTAEFLISNGSTIFTAQYASAFTTDVWVHVVGTFDGGTLKVYVNGVKGGTDDALTGTQSTCACSFAVGKRQNGVSANFFQGIIDDARVYNRTFSSQEVEQLYNFAPGPTIYYNFEEGSGSTLIDKSGNGFTGTWGGLGNHYAAGKYGKAGDFNGTNDTVTSPDSTAWDNYANGTFDVWVRPTFFNGSAGIQHAISDKNASGSNAGDVQCGIVGSSGQFRCDIEEGGGASIQVFWNALPLNTWTHIALTWSNNGTITTFTPYSNGVPGTTKQLNHTVRPYSSSVQFQLASTFKGQLDEYRFYNYSRTQAQITQDMNGGHPAGGSPVGSMIGYWKFDEGYGNVASNSGSLGGAAHGQMLNFSNPASVTSGWSNDGRFGKALNFDGSDDVVYGSSDTSLDDMASFSVSGWINPRSGGESNTGRIVEKASATTPTLGWAFYVNNTNQITFVADTGFTDVLRRSTIGAISYNTWQHVLVTWDGSTTASNIHIYVNGKEVAYATSTDGSGIRSTDAAQDLKIGNDKSRATTFDGWIDEVKVYNYILSSSEVKGDYNRGSSLVLGSFGMSSTGVASNSANAVYCVPGDTTQTCAPVAEWKFEEHQGSNVRDTSGNNNDGVITGASFTNGAIGSGLKFNGVTDYVTIPDSTSLKPSVISVEAWFNTTNTTLAQRILSKKNTTGYRFAISSATCTSSTALCFLVRVSGADQSVSYDRSNLKNNTWYHTVGTYDGSTVKLYLNGRLVASTTASGTLDQGTPVLCIGAESGGSSCTSGANMFSGKIDGVRIYNYVLSPAQVAWNYNHGKPIVQYKFDECQGSVAHDSSTNRNDATIALGPAGTTSLGACTSGSGAWGGGATGKFNSALSFDKTDDAAYASMSSSLNDLPSGGSGMTVSAWINPISIGQNSLGRIVSKADPGLTNGWTLFFNGNNTRLEFKAFTSGTARDVITTNNPISLSTWSHVVFVWNFTGTCPGTGTFYINGNPVSNITDTTCTGSYNSDAGNYLYIGNSPSLNRTFDGLIDDVQIFNYPLTAVQIRNLYNQSAAVRFGPVTGTP